MYKVIKFRPAKGSTATTASAPFAKVKLEDGFPEEEAQSGFSTIEEAREYIKRLHDINPLSGWSYKVEKE